MSILFAFKLLSFMLYRKISKKLIFTKLKSIQKNDYLGFNPDKYSKQRYYIRKFFVKNDRLTLHNRLMSIISNQRSPEFNYNEDGLVCNKKYFLVLFK